VYIVPGDDDILRYLNDSKDDAQIFSGFKPSLPFIFEASRDIKGPSEKSRKTGKPHPFLNTQNLDKDGELTLFYGNDYQFTTRKASAKGAVVKLSSGLVGGSSAVGSGSSKAKKKKPLRRKGSYVKETKASSRSLKERLSSAETRTTVFVIDDSDDDETLSPESKRQRPRRREIPSAVDEIISNSYVMMVSSSKRIRGDLKLHADHSLVHESEKKHFLALKLTLFQLDLKDAISVGKFDSSDKGQRKVFTKMKRIQGIVNDTLEAFVVTLNSHLDESNLLRVKATEAALIRVPLTVAEAPPLVHHSDGNCSNKKFDLISYSFLEKVEVEIRSHMDYLELFWWLFVTSPNDIDQNFLKSYEEKYQREPTVISVNAGTTLNYSY